MAVQHIEIEGREVLAESGEIQWTFDGPIDIPAGVEIKIIRIETLGPVVLQIPTEEDSA